MVGGTGFRIADTSRSDGGRTLASPDVAMCADCAAEQRDPADRRYRHAFVNCTNCGPRFTIIASLPYDRASHHHGGLPDVRGLRARIRAIPPIAVSTPSRCAARSCGPTLPYREGGTAARMASRRCVAPGRCCATAASSPSRASAATTWPATPPTSGGGRAAAPQAARRQAVRGHGARRGDRAHPAASSTRASARLLSGPQRPIVLMPRSAGSPGRRLGGAAQPGPRRDAGLHPAARAAVRAARATSRARLSW